MERRILLASLPTLLAISPTPVFAASPPPAFLGMTFCYRTDPNLQFIRSDVTLSDMMVGMAAGAWESARAGWIYRITAQDQLSANITRIAFLFEPLADDAVGLTGGALNGQTQDVANTWLLIRPVFIQVSLAKNPPPPMADPFASPEELMRRRGGPNRPAPDRPYGR